MNRLAKAEIIVASTVAIATYPALSVYCSRLHKIALALIYMGLFPIFAVIISRSAAKLLR